ncbi:cation:proton antiporter domain-containing protein [Actinoplanes aureus]|uniref:Cation:proton antiporter n=1 Tax=Actinoplanes aureus TaxID=2792083 RepID=A0A931FWX2_9ACTN|nr:cation:proton antiporter [Actinoplanes aureus]MBG0560206.1 cation:proton antiporter [Actinoplanes aureus]
MSTHQVTFLLLDLALILLLSRAFGALAAKLGQPPVIGEVIAGILAGPTLLGSDLSTTLFPTEIRPSLAALANIGVAMFMFMVGLELNRRVLRRQGAIAVTVSVSSIVLPLGLGIALATFLWSRHPTDHRLGFLLFVGAAMSVTAFPVLARILTDRGLTQTTLGGLALACAAIDDVLAWTLLAAVIAIGGAGGSDSLLLLLVVPYLAVMLGVVRPLLRRMLAPAAKLTPGRLTAVFIGVLLSGAATEWMGLHFLFGAFLFGVLIPRDGTERLRGEILGTVERFNGTLLLPVFFVVAGFRVDLSGIGAAGLVELALIMLVAVSGKFGGAYVAARLHRLPPRQSGMLATLMNTRGLTELIILTVGLQLGLLDQDLYSMMVVMAVVTTAMAGPLLRLFGHTGVADRHEPEPDRVATAGKSVTGAPDPV